MTVAPLVVHIVYALETGGLENGLINIINRMPAYRYRHAIVCLTRKGDFSRRLSREDVEIFELGMRPGHDWRIYWKLRQLVKALKPAILHTRNLTSLEMQLVTLLLPGIRRIHGEHGRDIHDLEGRNWKYNLLRKLASAFMDRYIAVSKDLQSWLTDVIKIPAGKVRQIYNGVDQQRFAAPSHERPAGIPEDFTTAESIVVGTVGRLAEVKNQQLLVNAFARLVTEFPDLRATTRLLLVGDGPLKNSLENTIRNLGIERLVYLAGDRNDVPQLMQLMDVFVLSSLAEGISNTVLEAMAAQLPVVATAVGGNPELVEEGVTGKLVPSDNVAALTGVMHELLADLEQRDRMGRAGRRKVEQLFDWERTVERYMAVYDEVLALSPTAQQSEPANM